MTESLGGKRPRVAAVLTAAGSGSRLGYGVPKALVELVHGSPETSLLALSASRLAAVTGMRALVVTCPEGLEDQFSEILQPLNLPVSWQVVPGAVTRQGSVAEGLPALAVTDTIKVVAKQPSGAVVVISATDRETLRTVQTPQGFAWATLLKAHGRAAHLALEEATAATDDSSMAQWIGEQVYVVDGSERALKITTEADLDVARTWLNLDSEKR